MEHTMKLQPVPFSKIASGQKTIELRLYDEKRKAISLGDTVRFVCTASDAQLLVRVVALHRFDSFAALYAALPLTKCGYAEGQKADPSDMEVYYSKEEQSKYGVLGIEIVRI